MDVDDGSQAFGVVAPKAAQGAAFEEDGGANARAVVDREALDIEDDAAGHPLPACPVEGAAPAPGPIANRAAGAG